MSLIELIISSLAVIAIYWFFFRLIFGKTWEKTFEGLFARLLRGAFAGVGSILLGLLRLPFQALMSLLSLVFGRRSSNAFGSAEWMNRSRRRALLKKSNKGLLIDGHKHRLGEEASFRNLCLVSPTGGGKTTRYIIPNVLSLTGSAVITDPSGEIFERTAGVLAARGYQIKVVDVSDASRSLRFNPLHRANSHTEIRKVADILVDAAYPDSRGDQAFWNEGAKHIISLLVRCLKQEVIEYQNLHNVRYLLNAFGADGRRIQPFMSLNADQATFDEYRGFLAQDDKVLLGVISTAKVALDKLSDPNVAALTAEETLHFETLRTEKTALYLIVPEHEIRYYSFFSTILYSQIMGYCMQPARSGAPYQPVYFLLDVNRPGFAGDSKL